MGTSSQRPGSHVAPAATFFALDEAAPALYIQPSMANRTWLLGCFLWTAVGAGSPACSPGDDESRADDDQGGIAGEGGGPLAAESDPVGYLVAAVCDGLEQCCRAQAHAFDRAGCESAATTGIERRQPSSDGNVWRPDAVEACAQVLLVEFSSCGDVPMRSVCDNIYGQSRQPGEPCEATSDCAPVPGATVFCGSQSCTVRRFVGSGEACTATCNEVLCADVVVPAEQTGYEILACNRDAGQGCIEGTCQPMPGNGEPCLADSMCAEGASCAAETRLCIEHAALGENCSGRPCAEGSWCSAGTCAPPLADGDVCYKGEQCLSGLCGFDENEEDEQCLPAAPPGWTATQCAGDLTI